MAKSLSSLHKKLAVIKQLQPGDSLLCECKPNQATKYAYLFNIKIRTSVCILLEDTKNLPVVSRITKITVI
jgi:hypothetical protein